MLLRFVPVLATGLALLSLVEGRALVARAARGVASTTPTKATNSTKTNDKSTRAERDVEAPGFAWGDTPVRGVNIGGWLVLEPWITPSLFENKPDWVVDEWTYGEFVGTNHSEIINHWATWFDYDQFQSIAAAGLNTVRIPVGFWSIIPLENGEPYVVGAYQYLKQAVRWCAELNLNVMVDLHGVPGSQNAYDNSGLRGTRAWFSNSTNYDRAWLAIDTLAKEFTQANYSGAVTSIELMNEPLPESSSDLADLKQFYYDAYSAVRNHSAAVIGGGITVVIHEAYQGLGAWADFMVAPTYERVSLDTHIYPMFDHNYVQLSLYDNLRWYCGWKDDLNASNTHLWTIVGEFTVANTDCARWLNGRGNGARYDNTLNGAAAVKFPGDCSQRTGNPSQWTQSYVDHLASSFETQTYVYELAGGWVFWTWRTEEAADWSLQSGLTYGWIPSPLTAKTMGTPCNFSSFITQHAVNSTAAAGRSNGEVAVGATMLGVVCALIGSALA